MNRRGAVLLVAICLALLGVWLLQGPLSDDPAPLQEGGVATDDGAPVDLQETPGAASGPGLVGTARLRPREGEPAAADTQAKARAASADSAPPPTVPFKGVVKDRDGKPVAGARVTAVGRGLIEEIRTNAKGEFERSLVSGRYDLLVRGEGQALVSDQVLIDSTSGAAHEFILRAVGSIKVVVLRGEDPISGVSFYLMPKARSLGPLIATGETDAGGVLRFEALPAGPYDLTGTLPDNSGVRLPGVEVRSGEEHELLVRVPETVRFSGTVRDAGDGSGVPSARIELEVRPVSSTGTLLTTLATAADGTFDAQVPRGAVQRFQVQAREFAPYPAATRDARRRVYHALRGLAEGKPVQHDVELSRGSSLDARIQDGAGNALPGVLVRVQSRVGGPVHLYTESDADGRFRMERLANGEYEVVVLSSGFYPRLQSAMRFTVVKAGAELQETFTLRPRLRVTGRVVDASGAGVGGARVWLLAEGLESFARDQGRVVDQYRSEHGTVLVIAVAETYAKADGSFVLSDVPEFHDLDFVVRAASSTHASPPLAFEEPDEHARRRGVADVGSVVLAASAEVHGVVLDLETRRPVDGVEVRLEPVPRRSGRASHMARTRENGAFRLRGLLPGQWRLVVHARGYLPYASEAVMISGGSVTVDAELDTGLVFAGVVRDKAGTPLPGARILVTDMWEGSHHNVATRTDDHGRFRVSGLPRDSDFLLWAARDGFATEVVTELETSETDMVITLEALRRTRRASGR